MVSFIVLVSKLQLESMILIRFLTIRYYTTHYLNQFNISLHHGGLNRLNIQYKIRV
jgi:hypothetical protein